MWQNLYRGLAVLTLMALATVFALLVNAFRVGPVAIDVPPALKVPIDIKAAAQRLGAAIRLRTISKSPGLPSDPRAFVELRDFLERSFPHVRQTLKREVIGDYSLCYRWDGSDRSRKPILLTAHLDVVPEQGRWTHPPFSGAIADGYIWGRGTLDDKAAVLAILEAAEHLAVGGFRPSRTIYFAFGHDEEIDGRYGAARIATHLKERNVRLAAIYDEGLPIIRGLIPDIERPIAVIGTAEKGYLSLVLTARTTGGHSSVPSRNSAIRVLLDAYARIRSNGFPAVLQPPTSETLDHLAPEFSLLPRIVLANRWLFSPLLLSRLEEIPEINAMLRTTAAATVVSGGDKDNVLPASAKLVMNFRILPGQTVEGVKSTVRQLVADPAIDIVQYGAANDPSPVSDIHSEAYRWIAMAIRQVFPDIAIVPALDVSTGDSRHYLGITDQVFRFRPYRRNPTDAGRVHGVDERVAISNYAEFIRFFIQLMRNSAGK